MPFLRFQDLLDKLESTVAEPLPGAAGHELLAPRPRREWPVGFDLSRVRHAATLLLVFPIDELAHIALTVRADTLGRHSGQVSFPGGVIEPGESIEQAALREAFEEVGLPPEEVRVVGRLSPLDIPVSGFRLHPIVATLGHRPSLKGARGEVARILEISVDELLEPQHLIFPERERDGRSLTIPAFQIRGHEIWGATAMVLAEFLTLLGWKPQLS